MSSLVNTVLAGPALIRKGISSMDDVNEVYPRKSPEKQRESESDSGTDTTSEDDDSSDEDKHIVTDPILKERLKQLDRYATPIAYTDHSPNLKCKRLIISNRYPTSSSGCEEIQNGLIEGVYPTKPKPLCTLENHSTSSDYRSHKLPAIESPTPDSNSNTLTKHGAASYAVPQEFGTSVHLNSNEVPGSFTSYLSRHEIFQKNHNNHDVHNSTDGDSVVAKQPHSEEGYMSYICEVCHADYSNQSSLRSHMKKHGSNVTKRHQCEQCPYSTQYAKNLLKHIESMHGCDSTNGLRCERCLRYFPSESSLREHNCSPTHCQAYRCDECGRVFKTKLRLKYHSDVHNPRKPYVCDVEGCDRAFRTPKYLKNHRDEFHRMQPKNYTCPVEGCDLVFHRKTHLKRHVGTHTDTEKKYHCQWPDCQRRFCSEETLNVHYRKHTGEKPFSCALCSFSCYSKPGLTEHYHLHHAKDAVGEDGYKSFCSPRSTPMMTPVPPQNFPQIEPLINDPLSLTLQSDPLPLTAGCIPNSIPPPLPPPQPRHRMADILESCTTQPPGPLDAEINGILDSLDKESDLPDFFSPGNFDFEHSNQESASFRSPTRSTLNPDSVHDQISGPSSRSITTPSERFDFCPLTDNRANKDCSLNHTLTTVIIELEKADLSGSIEEFEKAKSYALNLLPIFSTGKRLEDQIDEIVTDVLNSFMTDTHHFALAVFQSTRQFNRDEMHMLDVLEQQMLADLPLTAPIPPRKRGRRPKLQHQLQPYLERIFDLESVSAEAMASDLVGVAQYERSSNFYAGYASTISCGRGRGRGRSCRIRGGRGEPWSPSISSCILPDGTLAHTGHSMQAVCHGPGLRGTMITKRIRGGLRGRYRIDHSGFPNNLHPDLPVSEGESVDTEDTPHYQSGCLRIDCDPPASHLTYHPTEFGLSRLVQLAGSNPSTQFTTVGKTSSQSDQDENELEENSACDDEDEDQDYGATDMRTSSIGHQQSAITDRPTNRNDVVNQDALGEMLEDLGVIVKHIGERAAAKRRTETETSPYPQPLNLTDYSVADTSTTGAVASLLLGGCKITRNDCDTLAPSVQLPSMATLASTSVDTQVSEGTDTSRSTSETLTSPPSLTQHPGLYNSPNRPTTPIGSEMGSTHNECRTPTVNMLPTSYKSPHPDCHQRATSVWSCESMCEHPDENMRVSQNNVSDNHYPQPTRMQRLVTMDRIQEDSFDAAQSYRPTDLSTRLESVHSDTLPLNESPNLVDPGHSVELERNRSDSTNPSYPTASSSNGAAMGSLMSAVEAVDHLRSLSALGAKYTSNVIEEQQHDRSNYPDMQPTHYQYSVQQQSSPRHCGPMDTSHNPSPISSNVTQMGQHPQHIQDTFNTPNIPPTLNSLLSRDRKVDGVHQSTLNSGAPVVSPSTKLDFLSPTHASQFGNVAGRPYSPYHSSNMSSRCPSRGRTDPSSAPLPYASITPTSARSSASPSSSSSARSYLHDVYQQQQQQQQQQREQCYRQQQQQHQPLQQQPQVLHRGVRSPVNEVTTRQLLSEAAATAYVHGLGRCDGQNFMMNLPCAHVTSNPHPSDSGAAASYAHRVNNLQFNLSNNNPYQQRFSQPDNHYSDIPQDEQRQSFHANEYGNNSSYMGHNEPYNWYQHQLRQHNSQQALDRPTTERTHTAQHLAHSINEVSGLAAAAYAYHQYHQQQQAHRHGLTAATPSNLHYQHLFNTNARNYYNGPVEDQQFAPRDLALYPNSHADRREQKQVYLTDDYRNGLSHSHGQFFF